MVEPPSSEGAVQVRVAVPLPSAMADAFVGESGTVVGVTASEAVEEADVSVAVSAETLNVYGVPLVSPVMSQDNGLTSVAKVVLHVPPAGSDTTE